jgi:cell division protease FtsH
VEREEMQDTLVHSGGVLSVRSADVGVNREARRRRRLWRIAVVLGIPAAWLWARLLTGDPVHWALPHVDAFMFMYILLIVALLGSVFFMQWGMSRSPHVAYRPEQIDVRLDDVVGIDPVKDEVVRSLNLFLSHQRFAKEMGGTPRRGLLFEGNPGTGKTYTAKAMAAEAGVPFLFVSATAFQSMFYGATARKIRAYFKQLRKVARQEGGVIGFIEEIDAIATSRGGMSATTMPETLRSQRAVSCCGGLEGLPSTYAGATGSGGGLVTMPYVSEGTGGVVNELLVQMQSFDELTGWQKLVGRMVDAVNLLLPLGSQLSKPTPPPTNVLLIAATNRADSLDAALLRPGRFDKRLTFELPDKKGRRALIDHFLAKKAHDPELDEDEQRDALAAVTQGYSPVMLEHMFDEALISALRDGRKSMSRKHVERARLTEEIGLGQPVGYTEHEKCLIATHEAGHATMAYLVAPQRRLEILSIIKRREALGLLAHGDADDVYTRGRKEMLSLIQISMGGQCAEELFFGDVSTGPGGDLLYATNVAAEMIGSAGMIDTLVSYRAIQNSGFNDTNIVGRVLADDRGRDRVEALLQEQKATAMELLAGHRHLVEALRDALLEREELIGSEITDVLEAAAAASRVVDLRDPAPAVLA